VPHLPNLGLKGVNLSDTSYQKTKIYPIFGVPGGEDQGNAIAQFYGSFTNPVCVYDLPGGAIAMSFASGPVYQAFRLRHGPVYFVDQRSTHPGTLCRQGESAI
jgi:hypothetical protein